MHTLKQHDCSNHNRKVLWSDFVWLNYNIKVVGVGYNIVGHHYVNNNNMVVTQNKF